MMAGLKRGTVIYKNLCILVAPSILADWGTVVSAVARRIMLNGTPFHMFAIMMAAMAVFPCASHSTGF